MTFDQFLDSEERMTAHEASRYLRIDDMMFEGADAVLVYEGDCYVTRSGRKYHVLVGRYEWVYESNIEAAQRLYFDHFVWECCAHDEAFLIQFYGEWLEWQGLPAACALELLMGADLTPYQAQWLRDYSGLWDRVVA